MKPKVTIAAGAGLFLGSGAATHAQIDLSVCKRRPSQVVSHPVDGLGAVYQDDSRELAG